MFRVFKDVKVTVISFLIYLLGIVVYLLKLNSFNQVLNDLQNTGANYLDMYLYNNNQMLFYFLGAIFFLLIGLYILVGSGVFMLSDDLKTENLVIGGIIVVIMLVLIYLLIHFIMIPVMKITLTIIFIGLLLAFGIAGMNDSSY
ncbi:hypothetical protein [Streptococcus parauberis]|uniref:Uncharacterized protein n=1 Tax=Streptococcus parauberis NCFD 2020 TaxID=873447 RepID=F1Z2J4_9STRE|nr:hypothetical protein [Streptococcus parauberis]EGE53663.1 hypothetical protein SPB_1062 [Streptococcus parauberis NCFD 2020]KYP21156.1 hypothetical protein AKL13_00779 [Streptococcus parauberis]KYP21540.1 hypothetical protein TN39_00702 [Streptococcus parauberis]KYP22064.1 hypothetical protein AKL14_00060 [Streptococcus parauberis]KYP23876.1 hypothetical protein TM50_01581 [Streptococcus parauberis]